MAFIAARASSVVFTRYVPMIELTTPTARTSKGKMTPLCPNDAQPRIIAATIVTSYDSNTSAAMPAQSPTLSPTLSAIVAALRGSSSGIPTSTFHTKSPPTSTALVKIPPPTLINKADKDPPKPKPTNTFVACSLKIIKIIVAPNKPKPTVKSPEAAPALNASSMEALKLFNAALAERTFPLTANHMPTKPAP